MRWWEGQAVHDCSSSVGKSQASAQCSHRQAPLQPCEGDTPHHIQTKACQTQELKEDGGHKKRGTPCGTRTRNLPIKSRML